MNREIFGDTAEYKRELFLLWVWPVIAYLLTVITDSGMLGVTVLFFLPPAALLFHKLGNKRHIGILTLAMGFAFFPLDYIAHAVGLWKVETIFPRVFEVAALESLLWGVLIVPYIVGFHERYFDDNQFSYFNKRFKIIEFLALISFIVLLTGLSLPSSLKAPMSYLTVISPLIIIPLAYGIRKKVASLTYVTIYFGFVHLLHELAALKVGAWSFPLTRTSTIAELTIYSKTVPLEEFFVYILLMSPAVVCYHHLLSSEE